jgi:hypothetical protein
MRNRLLIAVLLFGSPVWAATYYVDFDKGDDAQPGTTQATAWKHAPGDSNAADKSRSAALAPGDVVLFKGGVIYRGSVEIPASGKEGNPITYKGDGWKGDGWGAGKAILDTSISFGAKWTRCASADELRGNRNFDKVYYTDAPRGYDFRTGTYENGDFLYPCQDPTPSDQFHYDRIDQLRVLPYRDPAVLQTESSVMDARNFTQTDPAYYDGAYAIVWQVPNETVIHKITGFDPATHTIRHEKVGDAGIYTDRDSYYAIMNHPAALSGPGQYYYDEKTGRLYVWPRKGASPAENEYTISAGGAGFTAIDKHDLVIEGFVVQKFVFGIRAIQYDDGAYNVEIRDNDVRNLKSNDWYAIQAGGANMKVINNRITDCQRAVGILAGGKDIVVQGNFLQRTSRQGVWFMGVEHSEIVGNTVMDISGTHSNGISIYLFSKDILVAGNKVLKTGSAFTYHGNGDKTPKAEGLTVYDNLFDGATNCWGENMHDVTLVNNTFLGVANVGRFLGKQVFVNNIVNGGGAGTVCSHNIYTALMWNQDSQYKWALAEGEIDWSKKDRGEIFANLANGDCHLKEGSPAIDAGLDATPYLPVALFPNYDFFKDIEGRPRARDGKWAIGAYACGNDQAK